MAQTKFEELKNMMDFKNRAQDYFRRWYIDGKIFFHKVIDMEQPKQGITDIRYIDPRKIRKVRQVRKKIKDKVQIGLKFIRHDKSITYTTKKDLKAGQELSIPLKVLHKA